MYHSAGRLVCLLAAFSCVCAWGQTKPAAYVYVQSNYSGPNNRTVGFVANAKGQLSTIAGSPWANNITSMAVNGTFVFGSDNVPNDNGRNIYTYRIESNGALHYAGATNIDKNSQENSCNDGKNLLLDHTGSYLYSFVVEANCNSESAFESFAINKSTSQLKYLGVTTPNSFTLGPPLTIASDNLWAYAAGGNGEYSAINGFKKASTGNLVNLTDLKFSYPAGEPSGATVSAGLAQADTTNHLAVNMYYVTNSGVDYDMIATYAINTSTGNLTTSSTWSNMPRAQTGAATSTAMAPSGKLLAVGGPNGLQLFHFNPSGQATAFTGLITRSPITSVSWDNSNHLYAISHDDSQIHVFTVTSKGATEVSGSPWKVAFPVSMAVQPE